MCAFERSEKGMEFYMKKILFATENESKEERFEILSAIAKYELDILNNAENIKLLGEKNERK